MAFVYLKLRNKESAEEILNDILSKYKQEVSGYDVEEIKSEFKSQPDAIIVYRMLSKKGGSLSITLPMDIVKYMGLQEGDYLVFSARKKVGKIFIEKARIKLERA